MNGGTLSRKIGEMMDIQLNELSKKEFDPALINEITPDTGYSIWTKKDPFGRAYFGVGNFCGMDRSINEDTDLSWLEWDGNEVNISNNDKMLLSMMAMPWSKNVKEICLLHFVFGKNVRVRDLMKIWNTISL